LQVGIRNSMRERSSLHDLTCFWQSTVVTLLAPTVVVAMYAIFLSWWHLHLALLVYGSGRV